jgi:hypothetical protein
VPSPEVVTDAEGLGVRDLVSEFKKESDSLTLPSSVNEALTESVGEAAVMVFVLVASSVCDSDLVCSSLEEKVVLFSLNVGSRENVAILLFVSISDGVGETVLKKVNVGVQDAVTSSVRLSVLVPRVAVSVVSVDSVTVFVNVSRRVKVIEEFLDASGENVCVIE